MKVKYIRHSVFRDGKVKLIPETVHDKADVKHLPPDWFEPVTEPKPIKESKHNEVNDGTIQ